MNAAIFCHVQCIRMGEVWRYDIHNSVNVRIRLPEPSKAYLGTFKSVQRHLEAYK